MKYQIKMEATNIVIKEEIPFEFGYNGVKQEFLRRNSEEIKLETQETYKLMKVELFAENWNSVTWTCYYCSHAFNDYKNLKSHLFSMHGITNAEESYYQCNVCKKSFYGYVCLTSHIRCAHYENLRLCCDVCSKLLPNYKEIALHRDKHNEELSAIFPAVFHCNLCEKTHSTEKELKAHIQLKHEIKSSEKRNGGSNSYYNGSIEETPPNLLKIENVERPVLSIQCKEEINDTEPIFQCGKCSKSFANEVDYQIHTRTHKNKASIKCDFCSKCFSFQNDLKYHQLVHTNERPFQCEICNMRFKTRRYKKNHLRVHSDERPFPCEICEKSFKSNKYKKSHILNVHSSERPYYCKMCSKSFKNLSNMTSHTKICKGFVKKKLY